MNNQHIPIILIATDYSQYAHIAEMYAIQMALDTGFKLRYLHVFESEIRNPLQAFNEKKVEYSPGVYQTAKLQKRASEMMETMNILESRLSIEYSVREGIAGEQILNEANESPVDFIVVGSHGVSGLKDLFVGSNAWKVISNSKVPVLAIPSEGVYHPIKNIAIASEYRDGEIPAIGFVNKFAKYIKANLKVIHIVNPFIDKNIEGKLFEEFSESLNKMIVHNAPEIINMDFDDVAEGLDHFCAKENSDWLVMSPEIPTFLEKIFVPGVSMTKKMSFLTSIPLLAIPDYYSHKNEAFWNDF